MHRRRRHCRSLLSLVLVYQLMLTAQFLVLAEAQRVAAAADPLLAQAASSLCLAGTGGQRDDQGQLPGKGPLHCPLCTPASPVGGSLPAGWCGALDQFSPRRAATIVIGFPSHGVRPAQSAYPTDGPSQAPPAQV